MNKSNLTALPTCHGNKSTKTRHPFSFGCTIIHIEMFRVPIVAQWVKNLTEYPWRCGFNPWTHSAAWVDPVLLWSRPAVATLIWPLAWEIPYATREGKNKFSNFPFLHFSNLKSEKKNIFSPSSQMIWNLLPVVYSIGTMLIQVPVFSDQELYRVWSLRHVAVVNKSD